MTGGRTVKKSEAGESLKEVRDKKKSSDAAKHFFGAVTLIAVLVVGAWLCYTKFFLISKCEIKCDGELEYTADEVLRGAGLEYGMKLYEVSDGEIAENIVYNLPYIDSVKVKRVWPDKIVFEAVPAVPSMYTTVGDKAFVLSQSLRVLSQTDDFSYIESNRLIHVLFGDIESCVAGEFLTAGGDDAETVMEIYSLLCENDLLSQVDELDITDKFDISFGYKSRFVVKLGDKRNLDLKIRFMRAIEEKLTDGASGIIDVSDENAKEGIVKPF